MNDPLAASRAAVRHALFGGEGEVRVWDLGAVVAPFSTALIAELAPRGRVGRHQQETEDELVIVLEGEGVLYVDGQPHASVPGSLVSVPRGGVLEIDNASPVGVMRYLIVKARSGPEGTR